MPFDRKYGRKSFLLYLSPPFELDHENAVALRTSRNPYSVTIAEDLKANLLGVKSSLLYGQNFDVKVDENRFVGFPLLLDAVVLSGISSGMTAHKIRSFNIAFVMKLCVAHQSRWPITWSA